MEQLADIHAPIRFNAFKHHRDFLMNFLHKAPQQEVIKKLDPICNNYIDIYTGTQSPVEIGQSVIEILQSIHVFEIEAFNQWVKLRKGYRQIQLDDQSEWVIRESHESERYIHIHPARTGPLVVRFKGSTLKTAYILKINFDERPELPSLEAVNKVRQQIGLSPVKKLEHDKGILKCYTQFFAEDQ